MSNNGRTKTNLLHKNYKVQVPQVKYMRSQNLNFLFNTGNYYNPLDNHLQMLVCQCLALFNGAQVGNALILNINASKLIRRPIYHTIPPMALAIEASIYLRDAQTRFCA